jgi:uncharacterized protein YebE (UPF0316 family)
METTLFTWAASKWLIIPIIIFLARIVNVSIGTCRIIFVSRGRKALASFLGFFELLIWIITIGQIMQNLNNVLCYIAFAGGFSVGNIIGIYIENKLALGDSIVQLITEKDPDNLIKSLKKAGYGVTIIDAHGAKGKVKMLYTMIKRAELKTVIPLINKFNPKAFYTIKDAYHINQGIFPAPKSFYSRFI